MPENRTCEVAECDNKHVALGYCRKHYSRVYDNGSIELTTKPSVFERIMASHTKEPAPYNLPEPCWIWSKSCVRGYGQIKAHGKQRKAHIVSYELHVGKVPEGLVLRHKCDVSNCINPTHLEPGTHKENTEDCVNRNRRGYKKLPPDAVREIRSLIAEGVSGVEIARRYEVTPGMVGHIKSGRMHANVV